MLAKRAFLVAATLALPLGGAGCNKNKTSNAAAAVPTEGAADHNAGLGGLPRGDVEKINFEGSIEGIDDMLAAFQELGQRAVPDDATDPKADLQAGLLQTGFSPAFLDNIDLAGRHVFAVAWPARDEGGGARDAELAANVAVIDPRKVIEGTPAAFRPQPLGDGVWEFRQEQMRVLLKEGGKELLVGFSTTDLERAATLRSKLGDGRRIRVRAWNLPVDDVAPSALLGLPVGTPFAKNLDKLAQELKAAELEVDFGTKRDFEAVATAEAPFHTLGIEPLGEPRASSTALESRLPAGPVAVTTLAWGKPEMVHQMIDRLVPIDQIPQPFADIARTAVAGTHGVLDQLGNDVVLGLYVDRKGHPAVLIAADVRDEGKSKEALRKIAQAINSAVQAQATLSSGNKAGQFSVDYKVDGVALPGGKADRMVVTIPKDFEGDFDAAALFLSKNTVETIAFVRDKTAVVTVGAGARGLATEVARGLGKTRKDSLAASQGLAQIRAAMGGCQICVAGNPNDYFEFRLLLLAAASDDKSVAKDIRAKLAKLKKVAAVGESAAGVAVRRDQAGMAVVVPESTMFASAETWKTLREVNAFLVDPSAPAAEAEPKRGSTPSGKREVPAKKP
jgi:hypothetical protein